MLILLPPSEGKTAPAAGSPVDTAALSHPALSEQRSRVADALAEVSARPDALALLGVGASLGAEVARNRTLGDNPAAPAARVYTGVLYDAAGMSEWDETLLKRARDHVRIVSALWGAVSPADRIPAYRLSMGTRLDGIGNLATAWRPHLTPELDSLAAGGLVVDCRSATYAAAYRPTDAPWVAVGVQREVAGRRTVVSHMAKHTRGLLTAHLLQSAAQGTVPPATAEDLTDAAAGMIGDGLLDVTLTRGAKGPDTLTLVLAG